MIRTDKSFQIFAWIYLGINLVLSSLQFFFRVFSDGWMEAIFALDLIIPASLGIYYLLFFSKKA